MKRQMGRSFKSIVECTLVKDGLLLKFHNRGFRLCYPSPVWRTYPLEARRVLRDNIAFLLTVSLPLVSGIRILHYNTSFPLFAALFRKVVLKNIPGAVEDYPQSTPRTIQKFLNTRYIFRDGEIKFPSYPHRPSGRKALVPFTCGKDSLLTLGLSRDLGLNPACTYINDTVSPPENRLKLRHLRKISMEFNIPVFIIRNEIERLNDFEYWNKGETCLGYCHMLAGFCFIALPVCSFSNARWIFLGNERDMDYPFKNKDGYEAYPAFAQTSEGTKWLDTAINLMSRGRVGISSIIKPIHNIAIIKILHSRYPELAKYEVSCDCLDAFSGVKRWCCRCSKCARLFIFMKAVGADPESVGMNGDLLGKGAERLYALFNGKEVDFYEKNKEARDEQLLAFYLACKNGAKGYLIDKFRKKYLAEASRRERTLRKKFFGIHASDVVPPSLRSSLKGIYGQELKDWV